MIGYTAGRAARVAGTLLAAAILIFLVLDLLPGNTARFILGVSATDDSIARLGQQLGLDQPAVNRFAAWAGGMLLGQFGTSPATHAPIGAMLAGALAVTVPLLLLTLSFAAVVGLATGFLAAQSRTGTARRATMTIAAGAAAVPPFWLGMLLSLLFATGLHWLPPGGFVPWSENPMSALASLILPALALGLPLAGTTAGAVSRALADAEASDWMRGALARGTTREAAMRRHGYIIALMAALRAVRRQYGWVVPGTVFVEAVFYLPGLGRLLLDAIATRDLPVLRTGLMVLIFGIVVTMLLIDLVVARLDPRVNRSLRA